VLGPKAEAREHVGRRSLDELDGLLLAADGRRSALLVSPAAYVLGTLAAVTALVDSFSD